MNIDAAEKLTKLIRTNFGPAGTYKMLVSGAGDIKITKDGAVLLSELQLTTHRCVHSYGGNSPG